MRRLCVALAALALAAGCAHVSGKGHQRRLDAGHLVTITHISANWNQEAMCRVETDKGVFMVSGEISGLRGAAVWISRDGYLFIEGTPYGKAVNGYYDWGREEKR